MGFWEDLKAEVGNKNFGKKAAVALDMIVVVALDFIVISFIFFCAWLFHKELGLGLEDGEVDLLWTKVKFSDVVTWGDFGTLLVFIGKNVANLWRSRE